MKYAIMICDYGDDEQIFLGIKEKAEVKSTIEKKVEEYVEEYIEEYIENVDLLGDIDVYVIAEDFNGSIKYINKAPTLNDFFNSNQKACYFPICEICSLSQIKVTI